MSIKMDQLGVGDVIIYLIVLAVFIFCLYVEVVQYNCDSNNCTSLTHAFNEPTTKEQIIKLLNQQSNLIIWKKTFIATTIISIVLSWWIWGRIIPVRYFLPIFLFIFIVILYIWIFHITHYVYPINEIIKRYINNNCNSN